MDNIKAIRKFIVDIIDKGAVIFWVNYLVFITRALLQKY